MKFGIDHRTHRLHVGKWSFAMPRSRVGRIATGSALVVGGTLGFLPVLGFWMVPLGLVVLSHDLPDPASGDGWRSGGHRGRTAATPARATGNRSYVPMELLMPWPAQKAA